MKTTFANVPLADRRRAGRTAGAVLAGVFVCLSLALGGVARAQSHCDAGVTKAGARKVSCNLKVYAAAQKTGGAVNDAKLTKCGTTFLDKCAKAKAKGDCNAQMQTCDEIELDADAAIDTLRGGPITTTTTATTAPTTTTTTTLPGCGGAADCASCGACGDGLCVSAASTFCKFRNDPDDVCVSVSSCASESCSADADCGMGRACAHEYFCCDATGTTCVPSGENCSAFPEICFGVGLSSCRLSSLCCDPCP